MLNNNTTELNFSEQSVKSSPNPTNLKTNELAGSPQTLNILPHYLREWTVGSAVSPEIAELNILPMDAAIATKNLGWKRELPVGGWWTSGVDPTSGQKKAPPYGQFKPIQPVETKPGKKAKYLTAVGEPVDAIWLAMPDKDYWSKVTASDNDVFITEGVKKAGAGLTIGLPTVAVTGVFNWVKKGTNELAGSLKDFVEENKDKTFHICFDSDYKTKKQCRRAIKMFVKALIDAGVKQVKIVSWDESYKGMDDFIKANGGDDFRRQIEVAQQIEKWEKQFCEDDDDDDSRQKQTPETVAEELVENHRNDWAFHNEQKVWRVWNGKYWDGVEDDVFLQAVRKELKAKNVKQNHPAFLKNIVEFVRLDLLVKDWVTFDRKRYVPFNNGVLDLQENKLLPHDTGYRFTHCLERDYSPIESSGNILKDLKNHCPHTYGYMINAMGGNESAALKMIAIINGVATWRFSSLQKFIYLQGVPGAGKGVFTNLLEAIIGERNASATSLSKLSKDCEIAKIIDKQLATFPDQNKQGGNYEVFKALTGGDSVSYRQLYKNPSSSRFDGTAIVTSNGNIFAGDVTGLKRRLCLLVFNKSVSESERSSEFGERVLSEAASVLSVALTMCPEQADALIKGTGAYKTTAFQKESWEMQCENDSVAAFTEERLTPAPGNFISSERLYDAYSSYCAENGNSKVASSTLIKRLGSLIADYLPWEYVKTGVRHKRVRGVMGLKFREHDGQFASDDLAIAIEKMAHQEAQIEVHPPASQDVTGDVTGDVSDSVSGPNPDTTGNVSGVTGKSQNFFNSPNSDLMIDWGEDVPVQLDLMAPPIEPAPNRTDEIVERLMSLDTTANREVGSLVEKYLPSELIRATKTYIEIIDRYQAEGDESQVRWHCSQLRLLAIEKGILDDKKRQQAEDQKKRKFLDKLANKARSLSSDIEVDVNCSRYQGKVKIKGFGVENDTYKVDRADVFGIFVVSLDEITIPDDAWGQIK